MEDKLLTRIEVQQVLRLSASSMFHLIRSQKIPAMKIGNSYRIKQSDLNQYLKAQQEKGV